MGNKKDIGDRPAYPNDGTNGMTIRQAYQMAALQGLIAGQPGMIPDKMASRAQEIADKMVEKDEERNKNGPPLSDQL